MGCKSRDGSIKMNQELIIIAAVSKNNVIGYHGDIPWHYPEDISRFKALTMHHPVIMGRKTYENILKRNKKPLSNRLNLVLTKQDLEPLNGVCTFNSLESLMSFIKENKPSLNNIDYDQLYIIGGQSVYQQTISLADKLEITRINDSYKGDTFFPPIDYSDWKEIFSLNRGFYEFITYIRRK